MLYLDIHSRSEMHHLIFINIGIHPQTPNIGNGKELLSSLKPLEQGKVSFEDNTVYRSPDL